MAAMTNRLKGSERVVVVDDDVVVEGVDVELDEVVDDNSPSKQALSPETQVWQLSSMVRQSDASVQIELSVL